MPKIERRDSVRKSQKILCHFLIAFMLISSIAVNAEETTEPITEETSVEIENETDVKESEQQIETEYEATVSCQCSGKGEDEPKPLTDEAIEEVLGCKNLWFFTESDVQKLKVAGYDTSKFENARRLATENKSPSGIMPIDESNYTMVYFGNLVYSKGDTHYYIFVNGEMRYYRINYVTINGTRQYLYCVEPNIADGDPGTVGFYKIDDENLMKGFYYGFGGPGWKKGTGVEAIFDKLTVYDNLS